MNCERPRLVFCKCKGSEDTDTHYITEYTNTPTCHKHIYKVYHIF